MNQTFFSFISKDVELLPFFVTGVSVDYEEGGVVREEGYQDYQWSYCTQGEGIFKVGGMEYKIEKGMAFFFKKKIPHEYFPIKSPWKVEWITFNGDGVENILRYMDIGNSEIINPKRGQELRDILKKIVYDLKFETRVYEQALKLSQELYKFLIIMKESMDLEKEVGKSRGYEKLSKVIEYINKNYAQVITLEELAEQINVTKYYLCRLFKESYHMKPFEYINRIRIQKAKEYMVNYREMKVKEIGDLVGFNDTSYFCLKFREYEGCSPTEFKKKYSLN